MQNALIEYLNVVEEPNRSACIGIYRDYYDRLTSAPAPAGMKATYVQYLEEAMLYGQQLYYLDMKRGRRWPFSLGDLYVVLFFFNKDVLFKHVEPKHPFFSKEEERTFALSIARQYDMRLAECQLYALGYIDRNDTSISNEKLCAQLHAMARICHTYSLFFYQHH